MPLNPILKYQKKKLESENGSFDATTQKEILTEAVRLEIRDKAVLALIEVLFDENILAQIKQHRNLFLRVRLLMSVSDVYYNITYGCVT